MEASSTVSGINNSTRSCGLVQDHDQLEKKEHAELEQVFPWSFAAACTQKKISVDPKQNVWYKFCSWKLSVASIFLGILHR